MGIEEILKIQKEYSESVNSDITNDEEVTNLILALFSEVGEFANEVQSFKYWKNRKNVDREKVIYEFIDIIKIWGSLAVALNFSAEDLEKAFNEKTEQCYKRKKEGY